MNKTIPEPARQSAVAEVPILAPPGPLWQERGEKFATTAARSLWEPAGARALGWLQRRCLTDETIRAAQLGYNEADTWESPTLWGLPADHKKIWLPRGIVMPWWIGGQLWRVNVRRSAGDPKYVGPAGWSRSLYNTDALESNRPVVLVEGEIDALTIKQVAEDVAVPVATGSTSGGRDPCWIGLLALAPLVLVAFDCDDGGEKGAAYWLKTLSLARRWRPLWNDVNQMAQEGADIRCWVVDGVFHHDARLGTQLAHEWAGANREPAKIKLEDLADYLETNQLQVVGGDANLHDKSWPPRIRLAERPAALGAKTTDVFSIDGNVTYVARR